MPKEERPLERPIEGPPMKGRFYKYGINFDARYKDPKNHFYLELYMFRTRKGLARYPHFKLICQTLWPSTSNRPFYFHPWADDMLQEACVHNYLGILGSGSSGKSQAFAVWGIVNYICAPSLTKVLLTSTTIKDGRGRIWGAVCDYWLAAPGLPGKLVNSQGVIRFQSGNEFSERSGIQLIPGAPTKAKESVAKMIGFKNDRMILIADELPELSEAIVEAGISNLALNPYFQLIGLGNPKNWFDPMSRLTMPENNDPDSVNSDTGRWKTKLGLAIHLNGLKSPNVEAGRKIYHGLIDGEKIEAARKNMGENSSGFWRMIIGFPSPTGEDDCIYNDVEIRTSGATQTLGDGFSWLDNQLTPVAALDPAFTNGGDRTMMIWGVMGKNLEGRKTLLIQGHESLFENVEDKELTRTQQIIGQFKDRCVKLGVLPEHQAVDFTGGGKPFWDVMSVMISKQVLQVDFNGSPSEASVSAYDSTPAKDRYVNRVSELWYGGHEYLRTGQIKGITSELANEMCQRKKSEEKGSGLQTRIRVESKRDMKARNLPSPDLADAFFILVELCRQRLGFDSGSVVRQKNNQNTPARSFKDIFRNKANIWKQSY